MIARPPRGDRLSRISRLPRRSGPCPEADTYPVAGRVLSVTSFVVRHLVTGRTQSTQDKAINSVESGSRKRRDQEIIKDAHGVLYAVRFKRIRLIVNLFDSFPIYEEFMSWRDFICSMSARFERRKLPLSLPEWIA